MISVLFPSTFDLLICKALIPKASSILCSALLPTEQRKRTEHNLKVLQYKVIAIFQAAYLLGPKANFFHWKYCPR